MLGCVCVKTNEITAPSKKSNGTVKGWLRVERTRGYFVIVQTKDENLRPQRWTDFSAAKGSEKLHLRVRKKEDF